jgi:DNA polymerase-3 subunit epsilon
MREVIIDTETTGLNPSDGDRIIGFACVELVNRVPTGREFHAYIGLGEYISQSVESITGISNEFLAKQFSYADNIDRLIDFLREDPIVAHNAEFDRSFLNAEFARTGRGALPSDRFIDTLVLAREQSPGLPASLDALCKRFNIPRDADAETTTLGDARLLARVYRALCGLPPAEAASAQEMDQSLWHSWWASDFSWEGLKKKAWKGWIVLPDLSVVMAPAGFDVIPTGARPATLQDYWREEEGDLYNSPDGSSFTRVHLPLYWKDGTPTGKAAWAADSLDPIIARKLEARNDIESEYQPREKSLLIGRLRAQFQGAVLLREVDAPKEASSPLSFNFDSAMFVRNAYFDGTVFSSEASFANAVFEGGASFSSAVFSHDATFDRAIFSGDADFRGAKFSRCASFKAIRISRNAYFDDAVFLGDCIFDGAALSGHAYFAGGKNADGAIASFKQVAFERGVNCSTRVFSGLVSFKRSKFLGRMEFSACFFDKLASFEAITWPTLPRDWHRTFNGAVFKAAPDFSRSGFCALAAFDGAVLDQGVAFDDAKLSFADRIFLMERYGASAAAAADFADGVADYRRGGEGNRTEEVVRTGRSQGKKMRILKRQDYKNRRLAELERGCRVLKQAMEKASNKAREQHFYRYELIARRAQTTTPLSEKIFSYLYDFLGNYGASIGRPFVAVSVLTVVFASVYWGLDNGWAFVAAQASTSNTAENIDPGLARALSFSASRIFPFGAFDEVSREWLQAYEAVHGPLAGLGVRILASLQSTFALTLVFMVGLAVRRKFQIN